MRAVVFTGQGSQFPGMGRDFFDNSPPARKRLLIINELLGFALTEVMFNASSKELTQTLNAQLAIAAFEVAVLACLPDLRADMFAGHSVGEYTAVYAAGVYLEGLKTLFRLLKTRAEAMQRACEAVPGTMAAVLGLDPIKVMIACSQVRAQNKDRVVSPANFNTPTQTVISGDLEGVAEASQRCVDLGARKIVPLVVSGAFHSPLMTPAVAELERVMVTLAFGTTLTTVYMNNGGLRATYPDEFRKSLLKQTDHPVAWIQVVENMIEDGATEFLEIGPVDILSPMIRRINPRVSVRAITNWKEAQAFNPGS